MENDKWLEIKKNCVSCKLMNCSTGCLEGRKTIEAQQKEIKQLRTEIDRQATELMACDALESVIQEKNVEIKKLEMVANAFGPAFKENQQCIEQIKAQNEAMREALEKIIDLADIKDWSDIQDIWVTANDTLHIVSGDSVSIDSTQKDNKPNRLYPQEIDRLEKENRQLNERDELATVKKKS